MKINITSDKARFIVNEEKRKVVCIFENTDNMFIDYANKNLQIKPIQGIFYGRNFYNQLRMPNRFVGVATCSPDDEFSVENGKLIAFSRAKDKVQKSFFKRANLYVNTLDKWLNESIDCINRYGSKLETNTERRHAKITELIGEPE